MKKRLILVIALCLTALTACSTNPTSSAQSAQPNQSTSAAQPAESTQSPAPAAQTKDIKPQPMAMANMDLKHPKEGFTAPVSFAAADVKKDGDTITLTMKVYEQELFDAVEVSQLKAGDTLTAGGQTVKVTEVKERKAGGVTINGGYEKGGVTLFPGDGGTYYQLK